MRIGGNNSENTEKKLGYKPEVSLLELLNTEDVLVKQLNTARHALVLASKTSNRLYEYKKDVTELEDKLTDVRNSIQDYMVNTLGVKIDGIIGLGGINGQTGMHREKLIESLYE